MTTTTKTIVCLANSRKLSGRCVAGIEVVDRHSAGWIRPVSDRATGEVSEYERQYQDGSDPQVLDIISVPLLGARPHGFQSENWLLDPAHYWEKTGRAGWNELVTLQQRPENLWINGYSTSHGKNDCVPEEEADGLTDSLKLIHVGRVMLNVDAPWASSGRPRRVVTAQFQYGGSEYGLRVTDPVIERSYLAGSNGEYELGEAFLAVSLGEPWRGYAYKLVATIIERAKAEGVDE